ncbi:MAG: bifunctional UDP-N-acetylglucosamine diphosphorylase/glucosamine-1-phosphate N-acetyltransferase GlmU [Actinobacteria bacterium]|nr:bifunctional UDP-N-acetylglucosamine diphosphorylase/glucosamine-1-phosphate N-acetyltransferase GlmU [Actinomycetota bacterium]MBL7060364.1 bifunctional UDP-N-acetylglucosamine diphosphorylase/glucosamine-1-phosphate N-acetyltransferase GlmU [Actinomycetota bacterium]
MGYCQNLSVIILAAGKGKRMKTETAKVLHHICYQPILYYVLSSVKKINPKNIFLIVGHKAKGIKEYIEDKFPEIETVYQQKQLGTAHAVSMVEKFYSHLGNNILIIPGDSPLITSDTLKKLINKKTAGKSSASILTAVSPNPEGYGRVIKDKSGNILKIVEETDATEEEKQINEINSSIYCFDKIALFKNIININTKNQQGEYYLTDIVERLVKKGLKVSCLKAKNNWEAIGINDRVQLYRTEKFIQKIINIKFMENGVTIKDTDSCYIGAEVKIGRDSVIEPFCFIKGKTKIGKNCIIGSFSQLTDCEIGSGSDVKSSVILGASIGHENNIGPYSYIRPGTKTGRNVKIGAFCEIKKSVVSKGSKIPHLSYIGDSEIGSGINIGASTVTVNYDGFKKFKTIIEDNVFIGSDTMLVAPVRIGKGAIVAAGSVITEDVEPNCLAIARGKQKNIKDGAISYRKKKKESKNK